MPSRTRLRDEHARRARGDEHELVPARPRDRVHEPDGLGEHGRDLAQRLCRRRARRPSSLSCVKPSTSNSATETSDCWRCARATSSSRTRPSVRAFDRPVSGSVCATRSAHSARSAAIDEVRNAAMAAAARSAIATSSVSSVVPTSCAPGQPNVSTPTHASTPPLATTSGRSTPVIALPSGAVPVAAERPGPVERGPVDRVVRVAGDVARERLDPVARHPEREHQLERAVVAVLGEDRRHRGADRGRARLDDHAERLVQVLRPGERRGARGEDGQRAGVGRVGHECLRVQCCACAAVRTAGHPLAPGTRRVGIVHRRRARRDPVPRDGRRLCSAR